MCPTCYLALVVSTLTSGWVLFRKQIKQMSDREIMNAKRGKGYIPPVVKNIDQMPDQKWHRRISFIKSGIRIAGYVLIPFNLIAATVVLVISEVVGIIEELV
tara:strand:+ start:258 stop:563 length:306 start_codon:yes stop_codon:yes gene_type:complete